MPDRAGWMSAGPCAIGGGDAGWSQAGLMDDYPQSTSAAQIEKIADGFMLHQPEKSRVHYLNHTAVIILELCNGRLSPEEIAVALQHFYELRDPPLAEVCECLALLRKQELIV